MHHRSFVVIIIYIIEDTGKKQNIAIPLLTLVWEMNRLTLFSKIKPMCPEFQNPTEFQTHETPEIH